MPRPPYTDETPILVSTKGASLISLLEVKGDERYADLCVSRPHEGIIHLGQLLEWLATNRPALLVKAQAEAARLKEQGEK